MSQDDRAFSTLEMDIWRTHESIFRKMYLEEKKPLTEVKRIMELRYGFPSFSVATYGAKLHRHLNLRKKLKKGDWSVVYQHYQQRQAEGKQSHMYLNNTLIPWEKAWKEIRRNRVRFEFEVMPLPRDVVLKTPPPPFPTSICNSPQLTQLSPPIRRLQMVPSNAHEPAPIALERRQSFNLNFPFPESLGGNISSQSAEFYRQLSLICSENTPWVVLKATLLRGSGLTPKTTHHHQFLVHGMEKARPRSFALANSNSNELSTQLDPMFTLARVIYLISNYLFSNDRGLQSGIEELLNLLCSRMPQRLVLDLLGSDLLSTDAAWEAIARKIHYVERKDFITFMRLGLNRPTRILPYAYVYLSVAVSKKCTDIVRRLIQLGARADEKFSELYPRFSFIRPAIFEAIASQNVECLQLLLEHCDVNAPLVSIWGEELSISSIVLSSMGHCLQASQDGQWELNHDRESLAILLKHGANVDAPCPKYLCWTLRDALETDLETKAPPNMEPSLLEHCYFYNKAVYCQLVPFSSRKSQRVYRDEICLAATHGVSALLAYFSSKPSVDANFLKHVLEEQFFLETPFFDSAVVRALLELDVIINTPSSEEWFTTLLCKVIKHIRLFSLDENHIFILKCLLCKGALLNSKVLALAVEDEGTRIIELLLTLGADFRREGTLALGTAARLDNLCAVSWLLQRDVDVNAGIKVRTGSITVAIIRRALWNPEVASYRYPNVRMLKYLMDHGAKLWCGSRDSCPFTALRRILQETHSNPHLFDTVNLILDHNQMLNDLPYLGSFLLEDSLVNFHKLLWSETNPRPRIFKLLLKHGAPVYPGAVLARLINLAAPDQLVLDLMDKGADINAYTRSRTEEYNAIQAASKWWDESLVSKLLERGGDINSPAMGRKGQTALQIACSINAKSEVEKRAQTAFVEFLLRNNTDVNAPPCRGDPANSSISGGYTALQLAAAGGNLELLSLLLSHRADVNLPSHLRRRCALDVAAEEGRLDALHFLLRAGALSYCIGQSGYEGAIQLANRKMFSVVADSLRRHIRDNEHRFYEQPALAEAHYAAMAERSWTDECFTLW
ncbi:hypothetical protein EV127DRAFT_484801 [Xylaria flabelliformis]|nr:hypothetical protein EV127DRAFT_484801 [Xylaria flabelliformis]